MKTKTAAYRQAKVKRGLLNAPKKWNIKVWKNLQWYWALERGNLWLYFSPETGTFWSLLSSGNYPGTGANFWTDDFRSKDPNEVVNNQLRIAKNFVSKLQASIDSIGWKYEEI